METKQQFWAGGRAEADKAKRTQPNFVDDKSWWEKLLNWYPLTIDWLKGDHRLFGKRPKN